MIAGMICYEIKVLGVFGILLDIEGNFFISKFYLHDQKKIG